MTSPAPNPNSSPLITGLGVGFASQLSTLLVYVIQNYMGKPLPVEVSDALVGVVAGALAYALHSYNNSK